VEGEISISVYDGNARLYSHTLGNIAPIDESEYIAGAHPEWNRYDGPAATRENRAAGPPPHGFRALRGAAQPAAP